MREKRIAQFREIESNEWMATVQATRKERNEQEQAIDRALFAEKQREKQLARKQGNACLSFGC